MQDPGSSSDDEPRLPPSVLNSERRGWAGRDLELEHQRQSLADNGEKKSQIAAVDLSQFRNEEVGKGYQAKHVVRQREAVLASSDMIDMSGGVFESSHRHDKNEKKSSKKKDKKEKRSEKRKRDRDDKTEAVEKDSQLEPYFKCRGLETFLSEIESMLSR